MSVRDYRLIARSHLKGQWGMMIVIGLIYTAIITGLTYATANVGVWVVGGPLMVGLYSVSLALIRSGKISVSMLFSGFKNFSGNFLTYLLQNLYLCLWGLLFVPLFIKPYSYALAMYIRADDPRIGADEAITLSRRMMDGYKWKLFCLHFSFIGWALLSVLSLGIGFLFLVPYMQAANAAFYEERKNEWLVQENA